jgi:hypothetical protein
MLAGTDGKERVKQFRMKEKNTLFLPATPLGGGAFAVLYCAGISAEINENMSTFKNTERDSFTRSAHCFLDTFCLCADGFRNFLKAFPISLLMYVRTNFLCFL